MGVANCPLSYGITFLQGDGIGIGTTVIACILHSKPSPILKNASRLPHDSESVSVLPGEIFQTKQSVPSTQPR